jgi:hypothetical protein
MFLILYLNRYDKHVAVAAVIDTSACFKSGELIQ